MLAGVIVAAFFSTSYKFDPAPKEAVWGKPGRDVRVLSIDAKSVPGDLAALADHINVAHADVVLVQRLDGVQLDKLAELIAMPQVGRVQIFYPAQSVPGAEPTYGNAVFSKFDLYEGRSIPNKGGSFGVWTTAVVDGHKFVLVSANLSTPPDKQANMFDKAWRGLGSPPMIAGGDFAGAALPDSRAAGDAVLLWGGWEMESSATGNVIVVR